MLRSAKYFLNIPIISLYNTVKVGSLIDFIIDPEIGKVVGIVGDKGIVRDKVKVVSMVDVREMSNDAVIVDNEDALVSQEEIVRIDDILKLGIKIIGNKVITESGQYLGKAIDFLLDDFFYINKLYVKPSIMNIVDSQLVIPRELIIKVTKEKIIVSDDLIKTIKEVEPVPATQ
ncbi:hypothetical protein COX95_03810 [bacterium CG_4_10_14_0_2_um_filter_33_32]|nr:MAG: hypothetical protein AUJ93_00515 [bacterium CG2_30_33_46]PIR67804.1 MAG: hypothetical protein COU50_01510 [bacterium CG10_big_fil_rev_8_21_14_0_10_33_18]PIU76831.1 MAG: hypothetical protein COS74_02140 [bacterium CG06_land_8_20_14_3_00_33_50]PIW81630.1 MAG: hypothetical protein COZ97_00910 [bacterium CG_4_8_14_3_um_filter_33_28]PIY85512.1 MAG: hypothetical protein COY76_01645 [bacterium CG_4_10_14_0_8_um_filter_33_57]PIZ85491.1 MAG: hypothetical protein COX95_03810 [bacterium CG_4_10_1